MSLHANVEAVIAKAMAPEMIDPRRTALMVIDIQEEFASPAGAMALRGADLRRVALAIERIEALVATARRVGARVAHVRVVTTPDSDAPALKRLWLRQGKGDGAWAICREGTSGARYYRIEPQLGELDIKKASFSGFCRTNLDQALRRCEIDTLVITGICTDCCVDSTVRDAFHRDYDVFVAADACATYDPETHIAALSGLSHCAMLVSADAVLEAWKVQ